MQAAIKVRSKRKYGGWLCPPWPLFIFTPMAASDGGVAAFTSWLIYECSDTIEKSTIPGSYNDERLTNVQTHVVVTQAK